MKLFLCSTLLVATQANFFRHVLKSHRVPHFLGAGQNHTTNKFHAVFQIVHDSDLANTEVEYFDCGTNDASTCLNGNAFHTVTNLSPTTVDADTAVTNVKDTNNNVYNLEYTPTVPKNHIITKLELNLHTIIEESYLCAAGHVPKLSVAGCDPCTAGKYAERGANSCSNCAAGKDSSAGAYAQSQCSNCAAGKYNPTAGNACQDCGTGKYADTVGKTTCDTCAAGSETQASSTFVTSAAEACVACVAGKADKDSDSSTTCYTCNTNSEEYQSSTGTTSCNTCETGTFTCGDNKVSTCASNCGGSSGGSGGTFTCTNTYEYIATGSSGYLSCATCAAGKDQTSATGTSCADCDAGEARAGSATAACASCDGGTFSAAGAATCTDCGAGTFSAGGAATCTDCAVGKYSTATGLSGATQTVCTDCATAKTTGSAGSGLASDCVFAVTMYGYVRANFAGTCQDECVEWHGQLEDNFNANDVNQLNATGADQALCNLLKNTGEMIKQQGCTACVNQANCAVSTVNTCSTTASFTTNTICTSVTADGYYLDGEVVKTCAVVADSSSRTCNGADVAGIQTVTCSSGYHETGSAGNNLACTVATGFLTNTDVLRSTDGGTTFTQVGQGADADSLDWGLGTLSTTGAGYIASGTPYFRNQAGKNDGFLASDILSGGVADFLEGAQYVATDDADKGGTLAMYQFTFAQAGTFYILEDNRGGSIDGSSYGYTDTGVDITGQNNLVFTVWSQTVVAGQVLITPTKGGSVEQGGSVEPLGFAFQASN